MTRDCQDNDEIAQRLKQDQRQDAFKYSAGRRHIIGLVRALAGSSSGIHDGLDEFFG